MTQTGGTQGGDCQAAQPPRAPTSWRGALDALRGQLPVGRVGVREGVGRAARELLGNAGAIFADFDSGWGDHVPEARLAGIDIPTTIVACKLSPGVPAQIVRAAAPIDAASAHCHAGAEWPPHRRRCARGARRSPARRGRETRASVPSRLARAEGRADVVPKAAE